MTRYAGAIGVYVYGCRLCQHVLLCDVRTGTCANTVHAFATTTAVKRFPSHTAHVIDE